MRALLVVSFLVTFGLSGCAQQEPVAATLEALSVGDSWEYEVRDGDAVSLRATGIASSEPVEWDGTTVGTLAWWGGLPSNAWQHGVQPAAVTWTDNHGAPIGWAGTLAVEGGDMLARRATRSPCPELPVEFAAQAESSTDCEITFQRVMPWGDTMERQHAHFVRYVRVVGEEQVEVPAGRFDAWHVQVADAYPPFEDVTYGVDLWYAPKACAIVMRQDGDYEERLTRGSCAATGWLVDPPLAQPIPDLVPGDASLPPTQLTCVATSAGAGVMGTMVEERPASCAPAYHAFALTGLDQVRVSATWTPSPGIQAVRLGLAGEEAVASAPPATLVLPAASLEQSMEARVTMDGASPGSHMAIRYDFTTTA